MIRAAAPFAFLLALAAPLDARGGDAPAPAPTPLAGTASATAELAAQPYVVPAPTGRITIAAGEQKARVEDKVSKTHPVAYSFTSPGGLQLFWVGVSSPKNDVFLTVFEAKTKKALTGTLPMDKAARILTSYEKPTELLLVAYTESEGTPFRFEVNLGNMSI
jgi:hypothetical protein